VTWVRLVAGTDTGVGKTVATAALAAWHVTSGHSVVAVKAVQSGRTEGESGDADEVRRLAGVDAHELVRLPAPLAPESAALRSGVLLPTVDELARRSVLVAGSAEAVLVEGSGGVAVRLDRAGGTLLDLGRALEWHDIDGVDVVLVVRAGLGTLNHTELSLEAVRRARLLPAGLVVGAWPDVPGPAELANAVDLPRLTGLPVLATIPAGVGALSGQAFRSSAVGWFAAPPDGDSWRPVV